MEIHCTYIGHATTLIRLGGVKILTDPHFGNRVIFSKRKVPLNFEPRWLNDLSCVLVSHMHYDHLNVGSYKYIASGVPVIVPEHTEPAIGRLIQNPVIELNHWSTHELVDGTTITAVPILHRGGRFSQLRYTSSNGYVIQKNDATVFFCADSAYGPHFKEIGNLYRIDLALLPMGSYEPRWFMKKRHMTPAEAVTAFEDSGARYMLPIHWGTFKLSLEKITAPAEWLEKILEDRPDLKEKIFLTEPGGSQVVD
jgi:L-ascorbate metabolism protein UlaG (beta-lactamase superfamily)